MIDRPMTGKWGHDGLTHRLVDMLDRDYMSHIRDGMKSERMRFMGKSYKAVENAPAKGKLKQSERKMQETPKMTGPLKYEKSRRGSRS